MIKELIDKLKIRKQKLQSISNGTNEKKEDSKNINFKVNISSKNNIYKIEVLDYITLSDYSNTMKIIDTHNIDRLISPNVLFNSDTQGVNKGEYYIFCKDNRIYNILINENKICISERTICEIEKEDRIIRFSVDGNDYHYFTCKYDEIGSSYDIRYYSKNRTLIPKLELSKEEFINDINKLVCRIKKVEGIEDIYNIDTISDTILSNSDNIKNLVRKNYNS